MSELVLAQVVYFLTFPLPGACLSKAVLIQGTKLAMLDLGFSSVLFYKSQFFQPSTVALRFSSEMLSGNRCTAAPWSPDTEGICGPL